MLGLLVLCLFASVAPGCSSEQPTCEIFNGRSANEPEPAEAGVFSLKSEIEGCSVFDSARLDRATFEETIAITRSEFDGAAFFYTEFQNDLVVKDSVWNNVRFDGSRVQGAFKLVNSTTHFTEATAAEFGSVVLEGVESEYLSLPSSKVGRLDISGTRLKRFGCGSCVIGSVEISDSTVGSSNFDSMEVSKFRVSQSQLRGGFASANFHADSGTTENGGLILGDHSNLSHSNFDAAELSNTTIETGAMVTLAYASFRNANLHGSNLSGVDASYASFAGADVRGVDFSGAMLVGADFSNALEDEETNFSGAEVGSGDEGTPLLSQGEKSCFPADNTVELESGVVIRMEDLVRGDRVRSGVGTFDEVFVFSHRVRRGYFDFIELSTSSGKALTVSASHLVYVNGLPTPARNASVGDRVVDGVSGASETVVRRRVRRARGLYNPHTTSGSVVVNGVLCSCYTSAVPGWLGQLLLLPERVLRHAGLSVLGERLEAPGRLLTRAIGSVAF